MPLSFVTLEIRRPVVGDYPGAEGGETGDDDGDGLFDGAPGADPGGGGGAAPGGVEDEADDGEESYEEGEREDAGKGELLFARDAGFEGEGYGDYGYCLNRWVSGGWFGEGVGGEGKEAVRRVSTSSSTVHCTVWDYLRTRPVGC